MATPVLILPFNETSGNSAFDNTGNGHTAALTNGPVLGQVAKKGGAVLFDGVNDYARITALNLTTARTISLWLFMVSFSGTGSGVIYSDHSASGGANLFVDGAGAVVGGMFNVAAVTTKTTAALLSLNTWYHIVFVYDDANMLIYINGVAQGSPVAATATTSSLDSILGANDPAAPANFINARMDDVRIYSSALSAAEILALTALGSAVVLGRHNIY
jgi:hypothetical protein